MTDMLTDPKTAAAKIDELIEENADCFSGWHEAHFGEPSTHGKWKARALAAEAALEAAQAELEESILTRTQDGSIAWGRIKNLERENSTFRHALQQIAKQKLASEVEDPNKADFRKWHEYSVKLARFRLEAKP